MSAHALLDAEIERFLASYEMLPRQGRIPLKRDFRIWDFKPFIPDLLLYEVLDSGADFLCRVAGENIVANYGGDQMGKTLSYLMQQNPSVAPFMEASREAVALGAPLHRREEYKDLSGSTRYAIGVIVPLSKTGDDVDYLLCHAVNAIKIAGRWEKATFENLVWRL